MSTWESIAWAPICFGLTVAGLIIGWFVWRKQGAQRGSRVAAWSLLPLALYLTGAILLVGRIGSAVVRFAGSFVFSPKSWAGVILFGLAAVGFLGTGGLPALRWRRSSKSREHKAGQSAADQAVPGRSVAAKSGAAVSARPPKKGKGAPAGDDDLAEVAEILKRRGIQ